MARIEPDGRAVVVADAGPLIHLDELACLDLLGDFRRVVVPRAVVDEVGRYRPGIRFQAPPFEVVVQAPVQEVIALAAPFALHRGECEALSLALAVPDAILLTDDTAARGAANALRVRVHGTIGVLLRAVRRGTRTRAEVAALLRSIPGSSSLHIKAALLEEVILELTRGADM